MDSFPGSVAGPDPRNPRPTRAFVEYSLARGLILDPARVRSPRDKPHVESGIRYGRERFWKGATFIDLADSRRRAEVWCRDGAGLRVHGTTRKLPRVVFEDEERAQLQPYDGVPYDVPVWREVTVHMDHHVSVQYALYSAPSVTCPPGTKLEARCDRAVGFDLVDVRRVERILVLALEHEGQPSLPADQRVHELPVGRFARPGSAFDHRFTVTGDDAMSVDADLVRLLQRLKLGQLAPP